MEIRTPENEAEWEAYYKLRYDVLRAPLGQPIGSERNDGDKSGHHFALFDEDKIIAIARLDEVDKDTSQVRFVAVDPEVQGKGYGRMIMQATETTAKKTGHKKMILHARDYAVDFYLSQNYELKEKSHLLFGVLQHYLMEKAL